MTSSRNLVALLLASCLGFGVAAVVILVKPRHPRAEVSTAPPAAQRASSPAAAPELERPPATDSAPTSNVNATQKSASAHAATVVIPPNLALQFEKQYRDQPPSALELAYQKLSAQLRAGIEKHAPEESLLALRREIAWLAERMPRDEGDTKPGATMPGTDGGTPR